MAKVFIPVRESSEPQTDGEGPLVQFQGAKKYIKSLEWLKSYRIRAKSYTQSTTYTEYEEREDFTDILKRLDKGDVLAFFNPKRFSRNVFSASRFVEALIKAEKIRYVIVGKRSYDLKNSTDITDLVKKMAETHQTTQDDIEMFVEGKVSCEAQGLWIGGFLPTGYKAEEFRNGKHINHKYIIDECWAKVYERIVDELFAGKSFTQVAKTLNAEKIATRGHFKKRGWGQWWRPETIRGIARNPFYKGKYVKGKWVIPPLITEEKWNRLQDEIAKRLTRGPVPSVFFLLRNILWCGYCGKSILPRCAKAKRKTKKNYELFQYSCSRRYVQGADKGHCQACFMPLIDGHKLDEWIWNRTVMELLTNKSLKEKLQEGPKKEDLTALQGRIKELEAEIKRIQLGKRDLLDLLASGQWSKDEILTKAKNADEEIVKRNIQILLLRDKINGEERVTHTLLTLKEISQKLKERVWKYTPEEKRDLLLKVIKKITIHYIGEPQKSRKRQEVKDREMFDIDIKYEYDIVELREYFRILNGSLPYFLR